MSLIIKGRTVIWTGKLPYFCRSNTAMFKIYEEGRCQSIETPIDDHDNNIGISTHDFIFPEIDKYTEITETEYQQEYIKARHRQDKVAGIIKQ